MHAWYVVHTKPRKESVAEINLERQGFETYLPWFKRIARQRGAWKEVLEPLFPRYLFLRVDTSQQTVAPIRSTLGVTTLVTFGNRLIPVSDALVDGLRRNADAQTGVHTRPKQDFAAGQSVAVMAGPFEGLQGVFDTASGEQRVAILLDVLGESTRVIIERANIAPA